MFNTESPSSFTEVQKRIEDQVPLNIRTAAAEICTNFGIIGLSDPMYISNVIANRLKIGDGHGAFNENSSEREVTDHEVREISESLAFSYSSKIQKSDIEKVSEIIIESFSKTHLRRKTNNRFDDAIIYAEEAFWGVIAQNYPEIKTGDLDIGVSIALTLAMRNTLAEWIKSNSGEHQPILDLIHTQHQ